MNIIFPQYHPKYIVSLLNRCYLCDSYKGIQEYILLYSNMPKKILKTLLYFAGGTSAFSLGLQYYLNSKVKEEVFPESTFYYKEFQGKYKDIGQEYSKLRKELVNFKDLYEKGDLAILAAHYDSPLRAYDQTKSRSIIGWSASKDVPASERVKLASGYSSATLPSFRAMTIPVYKPHINWLYQVYCLTLLGKYLQTYAKDLEGNKVPLAPACDMHSSKGSILFMPVPSSVQVFNFMKTPAPEINEKGETHTKVLQEPKSAHKVISGKRLTNNKQLLFTV
eukprot:TRINITY_DN64359_c0_g1_i1.p1 TRINITY_DN64359_c0_g1~~TRINITY_DN64359_c0_g1_i1.p1  ORF type:complete len:304 (+),score=18.43 TRINITY_DN64359_c0_g1_i1:77-913(+)